MSDPMKQAWNDVGDGFASLGKAMRDRYRGADARPEAEGDPVAAETEGGDPGAALREAFDRLVAAGREFGDRASDVVRDDEVRSQAKHAAMSLNDALAATVESIGEQVGGLFKRPPKDAVEGSDDEPAVVGVPPETPDDVRPSATGLVTGPLDTETDVDVAATPPGDDAKPT